MLEGNTYSKKFAIVAKFIYLCKMVSQHNVILSVLLDSKVWAIITHEKSAGVKINLKLRTFLSMNMHYFL